MKDGAGRPSKPPEERRSVEVKALLTPAEKEAAKRLAGAVPLGTWLYGLIRREIDKAE
jgi:hypothetical protein